jgi:hypothetical protein
VLNWRGLTCPPGPTKATRLAARRRRRHRATPTLASRPKKRYGSEVQCRTQGGRGPVGWSCGRVGNDAARGQCPQAGYPETPRRTAARVSGSPRCRRRPRLVPPRGERRPRGPVRAVRGEPLSGNAGSGRKPSGTNTCRPQNRSPRRSAAVVRPAAGPRLQGVRFASASMSAVRAVSAQRTSADSGQRRADAGRGTSSRTRRSVPSRRIRRRVIGWTGAGVSRVTRARSVPGCRVSKAGKD